MLSFLRKRTDQVAVRHLGLDDPDNIQYPPRNTSEISRFNNQSAMHVNVITLQGNKALVVSQVKYSSRPQLGQNRRDDFLRLRFTFYPCYYCTIRNILSK